MVTPATPPPPPDTLAGRTLARIEEAMSSGDNQCLPELMEIIHALSSKATDISVEQLADLVEKHVAVMAKVIAAANTFGYNPTGAEITTVAEAIQVIGFERIRSLVTSLILIRHADNATTREQRSTALLAVSSGLAARMIARDREIVDPELAFVSASLRQLGNLLIAAYLPEEYKQAQLLASEMSEEKAFTEVLGLSSIALTRQVLARARFPSRILDSLHEYTPKSTVRRTPEAQALIGLSSFAEQLCKLTFDRTCDEVEFHERVKKLEHGFGNRLAFDHEQLQETLVNMGDKLAQFTGSMGFGAVSQEVVSTMRWRAGLGPSMEQAKPAATNGTRPPFQNTSSAKPGSAVPQPAPHNPVAGSAPVSSEPQATPAEQGPLSKSTKPPPEPQDPGAAPQAVVPAQASLPVPPAPQQDDSASIELRTKHWRDGLVSLTSFLGDATIDLGAIHSLALDFVRQGFGAPEAVVLRVEADQRSFVATHGVGPVFKRIRGDRSVKRDERTVFGIAIARRENVLIHNTGDAKITPYLPAWASNAAGWGSFVVIPLADQSSCFSLMIVAWPTPGQIVIQPENARLLRSLLATVIAARKLSQA